VESDCAFALQNARLPLEAAKIYMHYRFVKIFFNEQLFFSEYFFYQRGITKKKARFGICLPKNGRFVKVLFNL